MEIFEKVKRYRTYFGETGGITVSGGEPLLQAEFVTELFTLCREAGIHTALDTSGCLPERAAALLDVTDLCLLDMKMTNAQDYVRYTRCELSKVLAFFDMLEDRRIPVWIRQVIVKGINDTKENTLALHRLLKEHKYIENVEFLPFRKLCVPKYHNLGIPFPLELTPETTAEKIQTLTDYYDSLS